MRLKDGRSQIIEGFIDHSTKFRFYFSAMGSTERALRIFFGLSQGSFKNLLNSSKVAVQFCVPIGHSSCSASLSTLGMVSLLNFSLCLRCVMRYLVSVFIFLITNGAEYFCMCFLMVHTSSFARF